MGLIRLPVSGVNPVAEVCLREQVKFVVRIQHHSVAFTFGLLLNCNDMKTALITENKGCK